MQSNIKSIDNELNDFLFNMVKVAMIKDGKNKIEVKNITVEDVRNYLKKLNIPNPGI